jgi:hypothetical protein
VVADAHIQPLSKLRVYLGRYQGGQLSAATATLQTAWHNEQSECHAWQDEDCVHVFGAASSARPIERELCVQLLHCSCSYKQWAVTAVWELVHIRPIWRSTSPGGKVCTQALQRLHSVCVLHLYTLPIVMVGMASTSTTPL